MGSPREGVIEALVEAATDAMTDRCEALNASPGEVLSANFTLLHRTVKMILKHTVGLDRMKNRGQILSGLSIIFKTVEDAGSIN